MNVGQVDPGQQVGQVGLVHRDREGDPVAEALHDLVAVAREELGRLRVQPAAAHREPVRGGEVVERHDRCEAELEAAVDDRLVVVERLLGELPLDRLDARPLDGEPVGVEPHALAPGRCPRATARSC